MSIPHGSDRPDDRQTGPSKRGESASDIVEMFSDVFGKRFDRWVEEWSESRAAMLACIAEQITASREAGAIWPKWLPTVDELDLADEADLAAISERLEDLIVQCNHGSRKPGDAA
jgi:hypothetical protein